VIDFNWLWTVILILPTLIDGLTQAYMNRESNNILRVITGLMYGIGLMSLASLIGKAVGYYVLELLV
jgi:uncharacterized membrane protein